MKITRCVDKKTHLTLATYKYWVGAFYKNNRPVLVTVFVTSTLAQRVRELWNEEYSEFRLLKGFPIQAHAIKFKKKCEDGTGNPSALLYSRKVVDQQIDLTLKRTGKSCKVCKTGVLAKPYTSICRKCCKELVVGAVHNGKHYVYGLYSDAEELLYVGVTSNPYVRVHDHKKSKKFHHMRLVKSFDDRESADCYEKYVIDALVPPLNILVVPVRNDVDFQNLTEFGVVSSRKRMHPVRKTAPSR